MSITFIKRTFSSQSGDIYERTLIVIVILFSIFLSGSFLRFKPSNASLSAQTTLSCCDTGDGDNCKPQKGPNQTILFHGISYGLLKTGVKLVEGNLHLKESGETMTDANGKINPIIVNSSDHHATDNSREVSPGLTIGQINQACGRPNPTTELKDLYFKKNPPDPYIFMKSSITLQDIKNYCTSIPDDEIVFVCKDHCNPGSCTYPVTPEDNIFCYGDTNSIYDVYFKLSDEQNPGVPEFIKKCDKSNISLQSQPNTTPQQKIVYPTDKYTSKKDLQLRTFTITAEQAIGPWLSPLCKPAIYLYPQEKTDITVKVNPSGPLTLTIPPYPSGGWKVTAFPNGEIHTNNATYDYLYYEAKIPNEKIIKPQEGYVVERKDLPQLFATLLPKLGLNDHERSQYSDYWMKSLPNSPYYFVGITSRPLLDSIAPLTITPNPDTTIRVTLYFQALDQKIDVGAPQLPEVKRTGFTAVEWGGLFQNDKTHQMTCLM